MSITRVAGQATGVIGDNVTSVSKAYPNEVTSGNLLVISAFKTTSIGEHAFVAADVTKTAGTATIGTVSMDVQLTWQYGYYDDVAIFSIPVTGTGTLTLTVTIPAAYIVVGMQEYTGIDVTASRLANSSTGTNTTGAPTTGSVASGMAAVFVGAVVTESSGLTTHTQDAAYTLIYESEDAGSHATGNICDQIVAVDTTDAASWTAPTTRAWGAVLAIYKQAAAGGPSEYSSGVGLGISRGILRRMGGGRE